MKKFLKITGIVLLIIVVLIIGLITYITTQLPDVGAAPELTINATPEMLKRGEYLAHTFANCIDCHSVRDFSKFAGPIVPGTEGQGGMDFGEGAGFVPASNITSDVETGIGGWTDGEIYRAITMGVDKEGKPLAPMMPYKAFQTIDENDILSIIAYIRTLSPVKNEVPEKKLNFPMNIIVHMIPSKPAFTEIPDFNDKISYGKYYAISCQYCHTPSDAGEFDMSKLMAGGVEFPFPTGGIVRSANITPDKQTGIGNWTEEVFIEKFKFFSKPENIHSVQPGEFNTIMPWTFYSKMTDEDISAVYNYLMTLEPIKNNVTKFSPGGPSPVK
jgi:mono/diheme cytochrome c family protein